MNVLNYLKQKNVWVNTLERSITTRYKNNSIVYIHDGSAVSYENRFKMPRLGLLKKEGLIIMSRML